MGRPVNDGGAPTMTARKHAQPARGAQPCRLRQTGSYRPTASLLVAKLAENRAQVVGEGVDLAQAANLANFQMRVSA
eukprot:6178002-Pleurochrysis_carterae.AAC.2